MAAGAPLAGIKVLELARILAGPWAGQILADLGLTTIRLLTNHPRKVIGVDAFGIEIVEQVPVATSAE